MMGKIKQFIFGLAGLGGLLLITSCAPSSETISPSEVGNLQPSGQIVNGIRVIEVKAKKYAFSPDPIVVRAGEQVRVELTSEDTTHGFALPAYDIDVKVEPGKICTASFTPGSAGQYPIHCSVFCGWGHPTMTATLVVLPAAD